MSYGKRVSRILAEARATAEEVVEKRALGGGDAFETRVRHRLEALEGALCFLADALDDVKAGKPTASDE
jgi:hypothetical protein